MAEQSPNTPSPQDAGNNPPEAQGSPEASESSTPESSESPEVPATPEAAAEQSLEAASQAAERVREAAGEALNLPEFTSERPDPSVATNGAARRIATLGLLDDIDLEVKIELGRTRMYVEDVLRLNTDSVVELDKAAGDPVDIYVNDRHVARGEVLVLNENFCVRISEIIKLPDGEKTAPE